MLNVVLLIHAGATIAMTGLIWFVQIVHYPLLHLVGIDGFPAYERRHVAMTTTVVGPLMLVELITAVVLVVTPPPGAIALAWIGMVLVAVIWSSTALLQVPCHRRLERGFDGAAAARLVATNWLRTVAWSARAVLALLMIPLT